MIKEPPVPTGPKFADWRAEDAQIRSCLWNSMESKISCRVQIADMFTKALSKTRLGLLCNKLGLYDIYSPAWGECYE